jgi:hypothetical protein
MTLSPKNPQLGALQRDLAGARDEQILRVVGMVDAMARRGNADALIAPLRPRLARLRPPRPLSLLRVLFAPLDPLLVAAASWRRGQPALPRTALVPLAGMVQRGLDAIGLAAIAAQIDGCRTDDANALAEAGTLLWPRAARLLGAAGMPDDWSQATGLSDGDYGVLVTAVAALLAQAVTLHSIVTRASAGIEPETAELEALLTLAGQAGPEALAMMTALLMARLPRAARMLQIADAYAARQTDPAAKKAADRAVAFLLDSIETAPPPGPQLGQAAEDIGRMAAMLNDLNSNAAQRPSRRARVEEIRGKVDKSCHERFTTELDAQLLAPATELATADNAAVATLEATARDLRRFETTARQLGGPELYDRQLRRAGAALRPPPGEAAAALIDRVRLVEILQGPEAAAAMLAE